MAIYSVCYRFSDGEAIVARPTDHVWGSGETGGSLRVAEIDLTQTERDNIHTHVYKVDDVDNPTSLVVI